MDEERQQINLGTDREPICAVLHRPYERRVRGAILFVASFFEGKAGRQREYVSLASRLAAKDFAVLRVDFRGVGDSHGEMEKVRYRDWLEDAHIALDYMKKNFKDLPLGIFARALAAPIAHALASNASIHGLALWGPVTPTQEMRLDWDLFHSFAADREQVTIEGIPFSREFVLAFFADLFASSKISQLNNLPLLHVHLDEGDEHLQVYQRLQTASSKITFLSMPRYKSHCLPQQVLEKLYKETVYWFSETLS